MNITLFAASFIGYYGTTVDIFNTEQEAKEHLGLDKKEQWDDSTRTVHKLNFNLDKDGNLIKPINITLE